MKCSKVRRKPTQGGAISPRAPKRHGRQDATRSAHSHRMPILSLTVLFCIIDTLAEVGSEIFKRHPDLLNVAVAFVPQVSAKRQIYCRIHTQILF
jgi:hypothetical protein